MFLLYFDFFPPVFFSASEQAFIFIVGFFYYLLVVVVAHLGEKEQSFRYYPTSRRLGMAAVHVIEECDSSGLIRSLQMLRREAGCTGRREERRKEERRGRQVCELKTFGTFYLQNLKV